MTTESLDTFSIEYANIQDAADELARFRSQFHFPSLADLKRPTLAKNSNESSSQPCTYLCGNSLGLQPVRTSELIDVFLSQWRTKGVYGHYVEHADSPLAPFLHVDDHGAKLAAPLVGGLESEVAIMGSLTSNLHILMSSFYLPSKTEKGRRKIMLEGKAFPSDHFAIESQIKHHGLDPNEAMILLNPANDHDPTLKTADILRKIDEHASDLALILLPGIQFYSGQYFDIAKITAHAHSHNIFIGWDLAHAAGNVELHLHDWDVDFAAWCSYKYLNSGPGAIAGIFVHERFGRVDMDASAEKYWPRLTGWWGDDKSGRFSMTNKFVPRPGAAGFQLSNPSALDLAAVTASLQIFNEASISALRRKSMKLTAYLEKLLDRISDDSEIKDFAIISPRNPGERGAQLSIRLRPGILDQVMQHLEEQGIVVDERKPDVIRVAPAPLYNNHQDVCHFCMSLEKSLRRLRSSESNSLTRAPSGAMER